MRLLATAIRLIVVSCAAVLMAAGGWAAAALPGESWMDALDAALAADAPYRNALYLYLRVAGIAWILVEWVAAILVWRAYRLLARRAAAVGLLP